MNLNIKKNLADKSNYSSNVRNVSSIKYIVVHYTANDGDSDEGNANYFKGKNRGASAHYFVDNDSITQSVSDEYVAWHCGGNVYNDIKTTGGGKLQGKCNNNNSIGIELCDNVKDGTYRLTDRTRKNAIDLIQMLMVKYNISINNVVRHFDVTGKYCPRYFCLPYGSNLEWDKFKKEIAGVKFGDNIGKETNNTGKKANNTGNELDNIGKEANNTGKESDNLGKESDNLGKESDNLGKEYNVVNYIVKVRANALNIRSGPGTNYKVTGVIRDMGTYTITTINEDKTWGKLKSGVGWINLMYTVKV